jgi:hypothetical protein
MMKEYVEKMPEVKIEKTTELTDFVGCNINGTKSFVVRIEYNLYQLAANERYYWPDSYQKHSICDVINALKITYPESVIYTFDSYKELYTWLAED